MITKINLLKYMNVYVNNMYMYKHHGCACKHEFSIKKVIISRCTFFGGSYLSGALTTLEGPTLGAPSLELLLLGVQPEYTASKGAKGALPLRVPTLVPPLPPLEALTFVVPPFEHFLRGFLPERCASHGAKGAVLL